MSMSPDIMWQCVKKNSAFLRKSRNMPVMSAEPGNLCSLNSFKYSGLANRKVLDISPKIAGKKESIACEGIARMQTQQHAGKVRSEQEWQEGHCGHSQGSFEQTGFARRVANKIPEDQAILQEEAAGDKVASSLNRAEELGTLALGAGWTDNSPLHALVGVFGNHNNNSTNSNNNNSSNSGNNSNNNNNNNNSSNSDNNSNSSSSNNTSNNKHNNNSSSSNNKNNNSNNNSNNKHNNNNSDNTDTNNNTNTTNNNNNTNTNNNNK
ncbi:unnamed protein product [Polarella glacialis]|uniref:Ribosomal eL28/Mak16 domain-containing protein n=1 Tax=Polarella glacialis TaxID=89957 RepID=A0A813HXZ7_POLGL|nr:unnamed protein product [Polarella glacialis]